MPQPVTRSRLEEAAFALFRERGYHETTVEDIAERAGVGRTTFFRTYRSKEDVIFPDHESIVAQVEARLASSTKETSMIAVAEAARIVLEHYLAEGPLARSRYRLTSSVPALRDRELASIQQYHRVFQRFIHDALGGEAGTALRAELMAMAVITAHNHVLRHWLRGNTEEPGVDFDAAMRDVIELFSRDPSSTDGTTVVVLRSSTSIDSVLPVLRSALTHQPSG
jgi:AcrR family transcriptional regulator